MIEEEIPQSMIADLKASNLMAVIKPFATEEQKELARMLFEIKLFRNVIRHNSNKIIGGIIY